MEYCKRCLYPLNHPLNIIFDADGICSGCRVHEEKYEINWELKEAELESILSLYRNRAGSHYDCVIPVTGNGDSFFVVDAIKNKFKLNPLLVTYNTQFNTKVGIRNLARLITELDCDHMQYTVGPDIVKKITRITMHKIGDMYWHVLAGSQTFPVQVATKLKIPLIIWGVNGWLDQVGMFSHHDMVEMTKKVRKEHALRGLEAEDLIGTSENVSPKDLQAFTYPSDTQLEKSRVRGIYLGNFVKWDAQKQTEDMIKKYKYETMPQERTFNPYETIFCHNNASVHDYIKFLKYGFGKATDHASRDIRLKRISREQAIELVNAYDRLKPQSLTQFLEWVGMSENNFFAIVDQFRDLSIWEKTSEGWRLKDYIEQHTSDSGVKEAKLDVNDKRNYIQTELLEKEDFDDTYYLLGRTYMDSENYKAIEG